MTAFAAEQAGAPALKAIDATPRSPAIDGAPPVDPNLARAPEAQAIHAGFVETLLFKGISTPIALVLVILQSRFLHASGRGAFVLVVLSVTIVARLLGQLGYAVASRMQQRGMDLRTLVHAALATGGILSAAGTVAIVAWGAFMHGVGTTVAALAAAALLPTVVWQCLSGLLLGLGRLRLWNVIQTLPPVVTLIGMVTLVVGLGFGVRGAVVGWTAAQCVTALVALAATRSVWQPFDLRRILVFFDVPLARLALTMGAVQVVNLVSYRIELFVLDRSRGIGRVGVYSVAVQTAEILWLIAGAIATAVTAPCLHEDERRAATLVARSAAKALLYTAIVAVVLGTLAPFVISPVLGHAFGAAVRPMRFLLPGIVVYAPVTVLVVYLSVRRGKPMLSLAVSAVGMVVTLVGAILLIPSHGAVGAALASTFGYAASAALAWLLLRRLASTKASASPAAGLASG